MSEYRFLGFRYNKKGTATSERIIDANKFEEAVVGYFQNEEVIEEINNEKFVSFIRKTEDFKRFIVDAMSKSFYDITPMNFPNDIQYKCRLFEIPLSKKIAGFVVFSDEGDIFVFIPIKKVVDNLIDLLDWIPMIFA